MLPSLPLYNQLNALNDPVMQAALAAQQAAALTNTTAQTNGTNGTTTDISPTGSRDTTLTKIFVGGLPYHTTDETLHNYFRQFGDIEEAVVITDRQTQKSRGYGFVTMKERVDAEKACRDPNPIIDGRKANVNLAYLGAKPRNNAHLAALSNSLNQLPQLQAAQLQAAALQLQQQQQRLGLAASVGAGTPHQHLYLQNSTATTAAAIAAAQQQAVLAQQQLAAVNPLAAIQLSAQNAVAQQPQNAATLAALAAQQAALFQQQQQQMALSAAGTGAMDYNQLLLAAAAQQQHHQHSGTNPSAASLAAAGYVLPTASAAQFDYSNAVAAAYPFLQQQSNISTAAVTSVTNAQSYAAQLAAQAQLAATAAGSTMHSKKSGSNSDSR